MLLLTPFFHNAAVSVQICVKCLVLDKTENPSAPFGEKDFKIQLGGMFWSEGTEIAAGFVEVDGWL